VSDFEWYFEQGLNIASGRGYVVTTDGFPLWEPGNALPAPQLTAFWPVGYPAFLGLLFALTRGFVEPLLEAQLANVVLYVVAIAAMARITQLVFQSKLAARIVTLILSFFPNHVAYTSLTSVEIFFVCLMALAVLLLLIGKERGNWWLLAASGLVFGLAAHTKPQSVLLPLIVLGVLELRNWRRLLPQLGVVYLTIVLTLTPWTLRNYRAFGAPVFVSNNGGINLLIGNMPGAWGHKGVMWNADLQRIIEEHPGELERDREARRVAVRYLLEHPTTAVSSIPNKLFLLYGADVDAFGWHGAALPEFRAGPAFQVLRAIAEVYYLTVALLFVIGLYTQRRARLPYFAVGPAIVAYFTIMYVAFFGGSRFHFPVVPWFAVHAAGLLAHLLVREKPKTSLASELLPTT
jgi:4-amino-4-deoxy-L-arabinose transferase-like glycosyltransferase